MNMENSFEEYEQPWISTGIEKLFYHIVKDKEQGKECKPFDVIIVGSGYGGSIAASELAEYQKDGEKLSVCVLERGKEYLPGMFPSRMADMPGHVRFSSPDSNKPKGKREGLFDVRVGEDVSALVANGLGGGSLINAGVMVKPHKKVFDNKWPKSFREENKELDECYKDAKRMLGATVNDKDNTIKLHKKGEPKKFIALKKLTNNINAKKNSFQATPITIAMTDKSNEHGVKLNECLYCGDCVTGCNHNSKESLDTNLLVKAQRNGVQIYTGATVLRLERDDGIWSLDVAYTDEKLQKRQGEAIKVKARRVILAAGALGSTEILLRSRSEELKFSTLLGSKFSTNGDMVAATYHQNEEVNAVANENDNPDKREIGPTITGMIDLRDNDESILIEEMAVAGPIRRIFEEVVTTSNTLYNLETSDSAGHMTGFVRNDPLAINETSIQHTSSYAIMGDDSAEGKLELDQTDDGENDGNIRMRWPFLNEKKLFEQQIEKLETLVDESNSGGKVFPNPFWKLLPQSMDFLINGQRGPLLTVHPLGGCPMGDDVKDGVVNEFGCVLDGTQTEGNSTHEGLVVLDGAIMSGALGANPALSIAAISLYAIRHLRDKVWKLEKGDAVEQKIKQRPQFKNSTEVVTKKKTEIQFIERMSGVILLNNNGWKKKQVELTLYFNAKDISEITHVNDKTDENSRVLTLSDKSRLCIYDKDGLSALKNDRKNNKLTRDEFKQKLETVKELDAPLTGSLDLFGREKTSSFWRRIKTLIFAWLPNRGVSDSWQHFFPKPYEKKLANRLNKNVKKIGIIKRLKNAFHLASRGGEVRTFKYDLTIGKVDDSHVNFGDEFEGKEIKGVKRITYSRRCNPWRQLMEMELEEFPLTKAAEKNTIELDLKFLARKNISLFRILQQHDQPTALADIASLGTYLFRLLLNVHLWSFRKPDTPIPYSPQRLPGKVSGLPDPVIKEIQVGLIKESDISDLPEGTPVNIRLTRYSNPGSSMAPLIMIHGYSASGTTFAHHAVNPNLAGYFGNKGRDIWIVDLRTSSGMATAKYPWKFEDVAATDIPKAIQYVYEQTGYRSCDIFAHCMGAVMLSMAILGQDVLKDKLKKGDERTLLDMKKMIRRIVLSQVGPVVNLSPINVFRGYLASYLIHFFPTSNYTFRVKDDPTLTDQLLDRLLYSLPYPKEEFDKENSFLPPWRRTPFTGTRHRMDALYGRDFSVNNIDDSVLEYIDDLFGPLSVETVTQVIHFAKWSTITDRKGHNLFVSRDNLMKDWNYPTFYIHGEENGLSDVSTVQRMESIFSDAGFVTDKLKNITSLKQKSLTTEVIAGYGHQDCLIGNDAKKNVFDKVAKYFECSVETDSIGNSEKSEKSTSSINTQKVDSISKNNTHYYVRTPWMGPRVGRWSGGRLNAKLWGNPNLSEPLAVTFIPVVQSDGKFVFADKENPFVWIQLLNGDKGNNKQQEYGNRYLDDIYSTVVECRSEMWLNSTIVDGVLLLFIFDESNLLDIPNFGDGIIPVPLYADGAPLFDGIGLPYNATRSTNQTNKSAKDFIKDILVSVTSKLENTSAMDLESGLVERNPSEIKFENKTEKSTVNTTGSISREMSFALSSCQYPTSIMDRDVAYASYARLKKLLDDPINKMKPEFLLLVGDQVYVDASAGLFDPNAKYDRYSLPYQRLFRNPNVKAVFRKIPVYAMLDDHEIDNNWGPLEPRKHRYCCPSITSQAANQNLSENEKYLARGIEGYCNYLSVPGMALNGNGLWYDFEENGIPFFMLDTRTERGKRNVETVKNSEIFSEEQWDAIKAWLNKHHKRNVPMFISSPSILLPRHVRVADYAHPAAALHSDGWDGYPPSLHKLLAFITENNMNNIVFLSGDEHMSCIARVELRQKNSDNCAVVHSIHSSALYAPFPFANSIPNDLKLNECFGFEYQSKKYICSVETDIAAEGNGFAVLSTSLEDNKWKIRCKFSREEGTLKYARNFEFHLDGGVGSSNITEALPTNDALPEEP